MEWSSCSDPGLLMTSHGYTDEGLRHPDGMANRSIEKMRKSQAANGISVADVAMRNGR
jgi:secreted PhoX family phosphatase